MEDTLIEETVVEKQPEVGVASNPFVEESWKDNSVNTETIETKAPEQKQEEKAAEVEVIKLTETVETEIKKEEVKTEEKQEQKKEEKAPTQFSFGDKEDELYNYLDTKKKLEKLTTSEVNKTTAEEIVKMALKSKYSDLSPEEIDYKFKKQFLSPKEPVKGEFEDDTEFDEKYAAWEEKKKEVEMDLLIEAKTALPELKKLKSELKQPDISQISNQSAKEFTPEEVAEAKKYYDNYLKSAEISINSFNGFSVEYKEEGLSIVSAYIPSIEEKKAVAAQMKTLADNEFNANAVFSQRWVNEDNSINTEQMAKDLAIINSSEKVMQKLVNDGVAKRLAEYRKSTSNIKVDGRSNGTFEPGTGKSEMDKLAETMFAK